MDMKALVAAREPELGQYLKTSAGISAEYATSSALIHAKNPEVKGDLLRILVNENLAEGLRAHAVGILPYAESANLPVAEEFGKSFVTEQYGKAMEEGNFWDAWRIGETVIREGDKITKEDWPKSEEWKVREQKAFEMYANEAIGKDIAPEDRWGWPAVDLQSLFDTMRFRAEGFENPNPSELARKIADKYIQFEVQRGRGEMALRLAAEANMPEDYIQKLGGKVNPSAMNRLEGWMNRLKDKVSKIRGLVGKKS